MSSLMRLSPPTLLLVTMLSGLVHVGCAANVDSPDESTSADELSIPSMFGQRVALARFFQHDRRSVPKAAVAAKVQELASLNPTWVSGIVRLDVDDDVTADHLAVYAAVRAAIPNARVDVVLNAVQYQGPTGWYRLEQRMTQIDQAFTSAGMKVPDAIFFDFYSQGQMSVMTSATQWTHRRGQKMGGTFWATDGVPEGTDFLVLDDHDGLDRMIHQSQTLRQRYGTRYPILAHIENNPGSEHTGDDHRNLGLDWYRGTIDRKAYLKRQVNGQRSGGYLVMYAVDFPLSPDMDAWDPSTEPGYLPLVKQLMK